MPLLGFIKTRAKDSSRSPSQRPMLATPDKTYRGQKRRIPKLA